MLHIIHPIFLHSILVTLIRSLDKHPCQDSRLRDVPTSQAPVSSLMPTKHNLSPYSLLPLIISYNLNVKVGTEKS